MHTEVLGAEHEFAVARAVKSLRAGELVALPTETVYGLAADALQANAAAKIFAAKERPHFDPLIVHLPARDWLDRVARIPKEDSALVDQLIQRFWPGPFTLVLPRQSIVPDIVTAGLETVAVRMSSNPVFGQIVRASNSPVAAPSANRFGRISPTTAAHVLEELGGRIPLIIDGGPTLIGLESTIVVLRDGKIIVLRDGPVTTEALSQHATVERDKNVSHISAPGQLASHYAPRTRLLLVPVAASFAIPAGQRVGLLASQHHETNDRFEAVRVLSMKNDPVEAAAKLFRYLRELDAMNLDLIVAEEVSEQGLGTAIMDRLRRAAR